MKRYYDLIAQIIAVLCILAAIGAMLGGNYLMMALGIAAAVFLLAYSKYLHKKEQRHIYEEDNPISAGKKRLYDEKIINSIKNEEFDPLLLTVGNIEEGSLLEYDLKTWNIDKLQYVYWKKAPGALENQLSKKAKMRYNDETATMWVYQKLPNDKVPITQTVSAYALDGQMDRYIKKDHIRDEFNPPNQLTYKDEVYFREARKEGYNIEPSDYTYQEFTNYEYYNETKGKVLRLNYWGDGQIDAEAGEFIDEMKFSNILPASGDDPLKITD